MAPEINLLLVDDDPATRCVAQVLSRELGSAFIQLVPVDDLESIPQLTAGRRFDAILLGLNRSTEEQAKAIGRLRERLSGLPIVVLPDPGRLAGTGACRQAEIRNDGPHGGHGQVLARAVKYAIERSRLQNTLARLAFLDELTGLYNRRGFFLLAQQQLKLAQRNKKCVVLLLADLDGLKQINDTFGHPEGDRALARTAEILRRSFRGSDVMGRLGGDEFAALTLEDNGTGAAVLVTRLLEQVELFNRKASLRCALSLSIGVSCCAPGQVSGVEALLASADDALYREKRAKGDLIFSSARGRLTRTCRERRSLRVDLQRA